jgi:hypothetical protein
MTEEQIRIECLRVASSIAGEPDKLNTAKRLYEWVTEVRKAEGIVTRGGKK